MGSQTVSSETTPQALDRENWRQTTINSPYKESRQ
jgi:hypothetical protein